MIAADGTACMPRFARNRSRCSRYGALVKNWLNLPRFRIERRLPDRAPVVVGTAETIDGALDAMLHLGHDRGAATVGGTVCVIDQETAPERP
jgi:hypothetical protein